MLIEPTNFFNPASSRGVHPRKHNLMKKGGFLSCSLLMSLALSFPTYGEGPTSSPTNVIPQKSHINVQEVKSKKGIMAWVVEEHEIPVVSFALAFRNAGAASDPKGLTGAAQLISGMIDEGAGELSSQAFKKHLLKHNIELTINVSQDLFEINFRTTKENVKEAFRVLKIILTKPLFDDISLARVKNQLTTLLDQALHDERTIANQKLSSVLYGTHPYGNTIQQTLEGLPKITDVEMRQFMKNRFARDQLLISAVGDISEEDLKEYLDTTFAELPEKATPTGIKDAVLPKKGCEVIAPLNIPQGLVYFAQHGISRDNPNFYAAYVLIKILGDGMFESRLWNEIREKRGLAYQISADLNWSQYSNLIIGQTATKTANVKEVITLLRKVWKDAIKGVTQAELDFVKRRMIGSFALNFNSTLKIAKALILYQVDKLGKEFINTRNDHIEALTLKDINKVAESLLEPEQLSIVIVGNEKELSNQKLAPQSKPEEHKS